MAIMMNREDVLVWAGLAPAPELGAHTPFHLAADRLVRADLKEQIGRSSRSVAGLHTAAGARPPCDETAGQPMTVQQAVEAVRDRHRVSRLKMCARCCESDPDFAQLDQILRQLREAYRESERVAKAVRLLSVPADDWDTERVAHLLSLRELIDLPVEAGGGTINGMNPLEAGPLLGYWWEEQFASWSSDCTRLVAKAKERTAGWDEPTALVVSPPAVAFTFGADAAHAVPVPGGLVLSDYLAAAPIVGFVGDGDRVNPVLTVPAPVAQAVTDHQWDNGPAWLSLGPARTGRDLELLLNAYSHMAAAQRPTSEAATALVTSLELG